MPQGRGCDTFWGQAMSNGNAAQLLEWQLQTALAGRSCRVAAEARTFVDFALRSARDTPVGAGQTTGGLLQDPRSRNALAVIERWLGGGVPRDQVEAAARAALDAAGG